MNIYEYIDNYGIYTFNEKEINMVDKVIFSCLSYIDYRGIVNHEKITIKEAGRMHLGLHKLDEVNIIAVREANKILRYIKDTKRYKDCLLFNYVYEGTKHLQFGAVSIAKKSNALIVPFGITGDYKFRSKNLTIRYGKPFKVGNMTLEKANEKLYKEVEKLMKQNLSEK